MTKNLLLTFLKRVIVALGALGLLAAGPLMAQDRRVALIIGNSNYTVVGSLPNPINDASLVANAAREAGFVVTQVSDLNREAFTAVLRDFRTKADTADIAMIYYAGHGIEDNGKNYLIPIDAQLPDPRELKNEAVEVTALIDEMAGAKVRIVFLDACRDSPYSKKWKSLTRSVSRGLSEITASEGSVVVFATSAGAAILDEGGGGNSYFAKAIAERLPEPGLSLQLLPNKLYEDVSTASKGQQKPFKQDRLGGVEIFLVPKPGDRVNGFDADEAAWEKANRLNTVQAYQEYMTAFPKGNRRDDAFTAFSVLMRLQATLPTNPPVSPSPPQPQPAPSPAPQPVPYPEPRALVPVVEPRPAPTPVSGQDRTITPSAPQTDPVQIVPPKPAPAPVAAAAAQPQRYVAPALERKYGFGNFPLMPDPPKFSRGPYPNCKDAWQSVSDPLARVEATNDCKRAFKAYKENWLNSYIEAMNAYVAAIGQIHDKEVAPSFMDRQDDRERFYNEMLRRYAGVKDGGYLIAEYEALLAEYDRDVAAIDDSYDRATGCNGYPLPEGLAPNASCPTRRAGEPPLRN